MRKQKSRLTDPTSSGHQWAGGWEPGSAGAETVGKGLTRDHMKASCGAFENDTALSVNNTVLVNVSAIALLKEWEMTGKRSRRMQTP